MRGIDAMSEELPLHRLLPPPVVHTTSSPGPVDSSAANNTPAAASPPQVVLALHTAQAANVAHFIRHVPSSADAAAGKGHGRPGGPNLSMQSVFVEAYRSTLLYRVALFAARNIEAQEELTCDFSGVG